MLSLDQALAALPDTADGIAAHLADLGCKGVLLNGECCPIANYLTGKGFTRVAVDVGAVEGFSEDGGWVVAYERPAVDEFVTRFDGGAWPELVAEVAGDA